MWGGGWAGRKRIYARRNLCLEFLLFENFKSSPDCGKKKNPNWLQRFVVSLDNGQVWRLSGPAVGFAPDSATACLSFWSVGVREQHATTG